MASSSCLGRALGTPLFKQAVGKLEELQGEISVLEKGGKPFQYYALGEKPFQIPLTEKYAIRKMKLLQRITLPLTYHKQVLAITQFMLGGYLRKFRKILVDTTDRSL